MLTANLGYVTKHKERIQKLELGGGALLDVGIYPLNFASMVFGDDVKEIRGWAVFNEEGADMQNSVTLTYADGRMAVLNSTALARSDRGGVIYGDEGYIVVSNINNCSGFRVYSTSDELLASYESPEQISGYEYEVEACIQAIRQGELECPPDASRGNAADDAVDGRTEAAVGNEIPPGGRAVKSLAIPPDL